MNDSADNEIFISNFIEKIRFAHTQMTSWKQTLSPSVHNPMSWRMVEQQKKYMEELLVEIGWQAIQLYEAGEFKESPEEADEHDDIIDEEERDDEHLVSEEGIHEEESSAEMEESSSYDVSLDSEEENTRQDEHEDLEAFDSIISEEVLSDFRASLYSDENEKEELTEHHEDITPADMWADSGVLLDAGSTKEDRDSLFRIIGSAIAKGFFTRWQDESSEIYDDIVRFFVSSLLYIQSFPKDERPQSALGDGAFLFLISKIPMKAKVKKKIARYQTVEESIGDKLKRMSMFWKRIDDYFVGHTQTQNDIIPFNEEIALNRLCSLLKENSHRDIEQQLLLMVSHGMSGDPRLIRLIGSQENHENLTSHSRFSALRRSLREMQKEQAVEQQEVWEHADFFREKNITVIGGEKSRILLGHFAQITPHANVQWVATSANSFANRVQSLTRSIEQGGVDFVLVIQNFISHSAARPLFKATKNKRTNTHVEMIENGYGKREIKLALKRCLQMKQTSEV